jgi:predicted PurR-regulated permease PerM
VTFVLVILVIACLAWAKPVNLPAAVAILLAFILNPFVAALDRRRVPRVPAVFAVVVVTGALLGTLGWTLTSQMVQFLNQLPSYQDNVARRVAELRASTKNSIVAKVEDFVEKVTAAATTPIQESAKDSVERAKLKSSGSRPATRRSFPQTGSSRRWWRRWRKNARPSFALLPFLPEGWRTPASCVSNFECAFAP